MNKIRVKSGSGIEAMKMAYLISPRNTNHKGHLIQVGTLSFLIALFSSSTQAGLSNGEIVEKASRSSNQIESILNEFKAKLESRKLANNRSNENNNDVDSTSDFSELFPEQEVCFDRDFAIDNAGLDFIIDGLQRIEELSFKNEMVENIEADKIIDQDKQTPGGGILLQTYDIEGDNVVELIVDMEEKNDITTFNNDAGARTNTNFLFLSNADFRDNVCRATGFSNQVIIEYQLPVWLGRDDSDDERLVQLWDDFINTLFIHETGHAIIAYDIAERRQEILENFSEPLDENGECPEGFDDRLSELLLAENFNDKDQEFDELTNGGANQQLCDDNPFFFANRDELAELLNDQ